MEKVYSLENKGDFSVPENYNVPTIDGSQTDKALRNLPSLGTRMEFWSHRDAI